MFRGEDDAFHAGCFQGPHPLLAVEVGWVEGFGWRVAITPFQVVEGVQPKVDEGVGLHLLPFQLLSCGDGIAPTGPMGTGGSQQNDEGVI